MTVLATHRATERDVPSLERLCADAAKTVTLWGHRRERLNPAAWLSARVPLVLVEDGANAIGFAAALSDSVPLGSPKCAEALAYVAPSHRRRGAARAAMSELISVARTMGLWKLVVYSLADDAAARKLLDRADFRAVGTLVKHVQIEASWRDVALHERLVMSARKSMPSIPEV